MTAPKEESSVRIHNQMAAVQDHSRQFSDFTFVYPVISRRSGGLSIGVNLNPDKVCNFDCVYCEVDRRVPGKVQRLDLEQMKDELRAMVHFARDGGLAKEPKFSELPPFLTRTIKDIAFSGDGEPTMINNFAECVQSVVEIKQELGLDRTKIVLITDAAGLDKTDVRRGLDIMDSNLGEIWAKLDAGTDSYFRLVNRTTIKFERILANLLDAARRRPIVIQSLFLRVHGEPMSAEELNAYCERLKAIKAGGGRIKEVHAYTIARPVPEPFAARLNAEELNAVADHIRSMTGLEVRSFD